MVSAFAESSNSKNGLCKGLIRISKNHKRICSTFIYKTIDVDGNEKCNWSSPLLMKNEYIKIFQQAGFATQTFIGYKQSKDDGKNPLLCFVLSNNSK